MMSFIVNGQICRTDAAPLTRLADFLRDHLDLTGTKIGCNAGDCGACTVLLDDQPVLACLTALGQVQGRSITTIEGLAGPDGLSPLQQAFVHHGAAQCGICTPGMLMTAEGLLRQTASPSRAQIADALGGVLCRCTGYTKIIEAIAEVAEQQTPLMPEHPAAGQAIGARFGKVDGAAKVDGREKFGADIVPADALGLRALRSPYHRARFTFGDLEEFRVMAGLDLILTAADVPNNAYGIYPDLKDQPVLAERETRYRGEAVLALVGAPDKVQAVRLADIPVTWEELPPLLGVEAALATDAYRLHDRLPDNVLTRGRVVKGDVEAGFAAAAVTAEGHFQTSFVEHAYIEPEAGFARRVGETLEIVACTQTAYMDRDELALILGFAKDRIRIIPTATGGGFGGKLDLSLQPLVAIAAWKLNRPVRWVYSRAESMASTTKRHPARIFVRAGADKQGRLTAFDLLGDYNTGAYASWGPTVANRVPVHASGPYFVPAVRALTRAVHTNEPPAGAFRGFGVPQSAIGQEQIFDDLAEQLGIDPLEFRRINALTADQPTATGQVLGASVGMGACLDALVEPWQAAKARCASHNAQGLRTRRGIGVAGMWYGIGNTSLSNPSTMRIGLKADGRVTLYNGALDIGQGSNTIMVQIAADGLGVPADRLDLVWGDTARTVDAGKTSASRQTYVSGKAALLAGQDLRRQILRLANVGSDAVIHLSGTGVVIEADGQRHALDLTGLPVDDEGDVLRGEGTFDPPTTPLDSDGQGVPYACYGFAAQMAEIEVDLDLGTVKVLRIVAAHDVGRAVNPTQVEGQIQGGIAQGLGLALMEDYRPGRTENLHDYLIPTIGDIPPIDIILIEDAEPLGPGGAKGIGEPALIPTAPAIFNAIRNATGVRMHHAPATPDRVRAALLAAKVA